MKTLTIKVGLIGLGEQMRSILNKYNYSENISNINIISICDIQNNKINEFKNIDGISDDIKVYQNYNEILF